MTNSPLGPTGYATVTRYLAPRFKNLGHEISIFAYWGVDSEHPLMWNGIPILPRWRDPWGRDIFMEQFQRMNADILLPIFDILPINSFMPLLFFAEILIPSVFLRMSDLV